jgi:hypothetical protein
MEVRVESAAGFGVPPGCYVGVRVGDVLKQGRYEPQRSYHFPAMERRRNAKIDIYRHVGSCVIPVDPEASGASHEVPVASSDPSVPEMRLKVNVQNSSLDAGKQREVRTKAVKNQAKEYLTKHSIEEKLSDAVKALLKEQPSDPTDFLCRFLTGGSLPTSPAGGPVPIKASNNIVKASTSIGVASGKPGPPAMKPFNGYYVATILPNVPADAMMSLHSKFPSAANRLKPTPGVSNIGAPPGQQGPPAMKPFNGYYEANVLPNVPSGGMNAIHSKFPDAADKLKPSGQDKGIGELRLQARDVLVKASGDGNLSKALKEVRTDSPTKNEFISLPSVGTWLAKPQGLKKVPVFSKMPSVGTWLAPAPEKEEDLKGLAMGNHLLMGSSFYSLGLPNGVQIL